MSIYNDKELFKLRDDIVAGTVVIVTKDRFDQLELLAISHSGLLKALKRAVKADDMGDDPDWVEACKAAIATATKTT